MGRVPSSKADSKHDSLREGGNQITNTMTDHANAIADYSSDTLVKILRDLQRKSRQDQWDKERMAAIQSLLKKRGIVLS